jgi:cytochrome b pre-mRNA-processing protein 3
MLQRLFKAPLFRNRGEPIGDRLYRLVVEQARTPAFYTALGVPDEIDARFELYTLHVLILQQRLRDEGDAGAELGQTLFDTYVSSLDNVLRELGVGDISVGKKMRKLGEAVYGRMTAYETPLREGDAATLSEALDRNVQAGAGAALADYALRARGALAVQTLDQVVAHPAWPEVTA